MVLMQMPLKTLRIFRNVALLLLFAMQGVPAFAVTYKWVDENGVTHYGDSIPPEYRNNANIELNKRGVILKKNDPALTVEERKAKEAELAKQRKQETEQKRKDTILMKTYSSVEEIDLARDRNLQQAERVVKDTQTRLKSVQSDLDESRKHAAAYVRENTPVPGGLQYDIETLEKNKQDLELAILQKRTDAEELRARFEEDKKHYIELIQRASASAKPASTKPASAK